MAVIPITIPDNQVSRVQDGICAFYGYQATLDNGTPNPETKAAFSKRMIIQQMKSWVKQSEQSTASQTAAAAADAQITIT